MSNSSLGFEVKLPGRLPSASAQGAGAHWGARFLLVSLMLGSAGWASQAPEPGSTNQQSSPRSRLFSADAVLDRRVSISPRTIYLGEFLDLLSKDPDFDLEADDRISNISGYSVTVVVHGRPVREVMEGLASLFHQPPDRWYWTKVRRSGRQVYTLHNTLPPGILRQSESAFVEEFLVAEHAARKEFFSSPPGRRAAIASADPSLRGADKPRSEGFFSFLAGLSDADLRSIIRGRPLHIPTASLSTAQRDFIRNEYRQAFSLNGEDPGQADQLDRVTLRRGGGGSPHVVLDLGKIGGWGVLGGNSLKEALSDRTRRTWLSGDDSLTAEDRTVPAPGVETRPADLAIDRVSRDRILEKLGALGKLNILYDHVGAATFGLDRGLEGKLGDVLANLERAGLAWKRRGVFYLFRSQAAPADSRAAAVAWPIIRSLRASASGAGGYLSADDWIWMAGLQREQLEGLAEEFPDAYRVRNLQPLVQVYASMTAKERAASAESEGSGWTDWKDATRARISQLLIPGDPRRARLLFKWEGSATPPRALVYLGVPEGALRPMELPLNPRKERRAGPGDGGVRPSAVR